MLNNILGYNTIQLDGSPVLEHRGIQPGPPSTVDPRPIPNQGLRSTRTGGLHKSAGPVRRPVQINPGCGWPGSAPLAAAVRDGRRAKLGHRGAVSAAHDPASAEQHQGGVQSDPDSPGGHPEQSAIYPEGAAEGGD